MKKINAKRTGPNRLVQTLLAGGLIAALCLANLTTVQAEAIAGPQDPEELAAFLDGALATAMHANHVPGAVVVVVKDGEVFYSGGHGVADLENNTPVDPNTTLFRPGSVSKLFTWTAVMQLVEQGTLDLDADVNQYLDFEIPATFAEPITLRRLMTHTPGFEDQGQGLFKLDPAEVVSLGDYLKTSIPARVFPPGEVGAYSNYGTALAGYIVERASGLPFADYIEQQIFAPLGMEHATFRQPVPESLRADMSGGYNHVNGEYIPGEFEYVVGTPAGALSASGLDMARFMIAHLQNGIYEGNRILQDETAQLMHSPLYSADARIDGMAHGFFYQHINGQYALSHGGDTMLFHSNLTLLPEQNLGFFISTNGTGGAAAVEWVLNAFFQHYYPAPSTKPITAAADFHTRAEQYSGNYIMARSSFTAMEKILNLTMPVTVQVTPEDRVLLTFGGQTTAFVETEPGLLVDPADPDNRLVMKEVNGQVRIHPPVPFVFLKSSWYQTASFQALLFMGGLVLFIAAIIGWGISYFRSRKQNHTPPVGAQAAGWTAGLFGAGLLGFIVGLVLLLADMHPGMGVPRIYFTEPAVLPILMAIPVGLSLLGILTAVFGITAWVRRWWNPGARVFYSLLSVWSLAILWGLSYWNLLF